MYRSVNFPVVGDRAWYTKEKLALYTLGMIAIAVTIPARNRKALTCNILSQLYQQAATLRDLDLTAIVVDDGSTDGTPEAIRHRFPQACLLLGDGSLWWGGATAKAMQYALDRLEFDYILWVNDDVILDDRFLENVKEVCSDPNYENAIVSGIVRDTRYPDWIVFSGLAGGRPVRSLEAFGEAEFLEAEQVAGNITLIPKAVLEKAGLPDTDWLPHYSDYEYCLRSRFKFGFRVLISRKLQARTDYEFYSEFIRHSPAWLQWYLERGSDRRREILQGFHETKVHYNIEHQVKMRHWWTRDIPEWKYWFYYTKQVLQLWAIDLLPPIAMKRRVLDYARTENVPQEYVNKILPLRGQ